MRELLEARLAELQEEIAKGERQWHEVDQEQTRLRETLLRMSGAIQVLHELLAETGTSTVPEPNGSEPKARERVNLSDSEPSIASTSR
jgi:hypothetical protein